VIHPQELSAKHQQWHLVSNEVKLDKKWRWILPTNYLFHIPQGSSTCRKILRHCTDGFTSPRRKSCYGFLSSLKIDRLRLGMNPRTLAPMASTITTRPPRRMNRRLSRSQSWSGPGGQDIYRKSNPGRPARSKVLYCKIKGAQLWLFISVLKPWKLFSIASIFR
jgi:hypothetical protein